MIRNSQPKNVIWQVFFICGFTLAVIVKSNSSVAVCQDDSPFESRATWETPSNSFLGSELAKWGVANQISDAEQRQASLVLNEHLAQATPPLDAMLNAIFSVRSEYETDFKGIAEESLRLSVQDTDGIRTRLDLELAGIKLANVQLYIGRRLANQKQFDRAFQWLENIEPKEVWDPAALLYTRGLLAHQLIRKKECQSDLTQLLQNESSIPQRYIVLAKIMLQDVESVETDSLDEISRLMQDIHRRVDIYESGKLVLDQEKNVIEKLDRLIKRLESQAASQSSAMGAASQPMQDSGNAGGQGEGDVAAKLQVEGGNWGDLPPAERASALTDLTKQMPPHYRPVIEEYFRQLAKEPDR